MDLFFGPYALADDQDVMQGYYGNTWEYIGYDGTKYLNIDPDFTFKMLHYDNKAYQGAWEIQGGRICFTVGGDKSCFVDIAGRTEGERWQGVHHTGNPYTGIIHPERTSIEELQKRTHH
jgi:hypothetical protein